MRRCTGIPADAERHAITCLVDANEFDKASQIIYSLYHSRKVKNVDGQLSASLNEAALHACRRKAAEFVTAESFSFLPKTALAWILATKRRHNETQVRDEAPSREQRMRGMCSLLITAHGHMAGFSVDAVRRLPLAEVMSALLNQEAVGSQAIPIVSQDVEELRVDFVDLSETPKPRGKSPDANLTSSTNSNHRHTNELAVPPKELIVAVNSTRNGESAGSGEDEFL